MFGGFYWFSLSGVLKKNGVVLVGCNYINTEDIAMDV